MIRRVRITLAKAPALGDIRRLGAGDSIEVHSDAHMRKDWPRYADAIAVAVTRGAGVRRVA